MFVGQTPAVLSSTFAEPARHRCRKSPGLGKGERSVFLRLIELAVGRWARTPSNDPGSLRTLSPCQKSCVLPQSGSGSFRAASASELLVQSCQDRFLICEDLFLIRKNSAERALVLLDDCLVGQDRLLVFQDGRLMAEDPFLIRDNLLV